MSIQLVLYPQNYQGVYTSPILNQYVADGVNFYLLNSLSGYAVPLNESDPVADTLISSQPIAAWKRFRTTGTPFENVSIPTQGFANDVIFYSSNSGTSSSGIYQQIENLNFGVQYELQITISQAAAGGSLIIGSTGSSVQGVQTLGSGTIQTYPTSFANVLTFNFTAGHFQEILTLDYRNNNGTQLKISSISIKDKVNAPSNIFAEVTDGQVICDLYQEEDIPLSLSIDDFKNVAEKVQSYSKDFNLPATKRNNKIFTHLFDVTRIQDAFSFNPYVKTQCILKQNGYTIFQGYLKLLDIVNKEGEISYSVNLYSENIALKEVLENRKFRDLDFSELTHDYQKTNIKASWYDNTGITLTFPLTPASNAYDPTLTNPTLHTTVLKYPFVNWVGDYDVDSNNNIKLNSLEDAFRPFINCKYIIKQIFDDTNFTYTSDFIDGALFSKMFMDFNWGAGNAPTDSEHTGNADLITSVNISSTLAPVIFDNFSFPFEFGYNSSTAIFTCTANNTIYQFDYHYTFSFLVTSTLLVRWVHKDSIGNLVGNGQINQQTIVQSTNSSYVYTGTVIETLNNGDTFNIEVSSSINNGIRAIGQQITPSTQIDNTYMSGTITINSMLNSVLLNTLRGDLGQWEFLKSLINMFNLVVLQDKNNPNNLNIEPYSEIFIKNSLGTSLASRGILYDWTDKIDITEIKLSPLDLVKTTMFKYANDDSYPNNYYRNITQVDYGSYKFTNPDLTLLTGEDEISAEPFSATVIKPLADYLGDFIVPVIYSSNDDNTEFESFNNNPRILFNVSPNPFTLSGGVEYKIPSQNGVSGEQATEYLRFSHTTKVPSAYTDTDLNFGEIQLINMGVAPVDNLYNTYWSPYYNELYNPDTKYMTLKVNLNASDINQFNFYDQVMIKNKNYRVNKIEYKPNDLSTVEFILIG